MTSTLPTNDANKKIIRDLMKKLEEDVRGKEKLPHIKLTAKGKTSYEPVYTFPSSMLYFNKANGRIKSEVLEKEADLGRELDIWNPEDQKDFRNLLLSIRKEENQKIKEDLATNTQTTPGIITSDGIVINGNRRKALFEELFEETGEEKYKYLEVQVLPSNINKSELWLIEAGIQLSQPQQLDYSPTNNLLKLREGINAGLSARDISVRLYGITEEDINNDLDRLNLIDEYLDTFLNKPGKYYLIKGLAEHFIDLQNIVNWAKRPRGKKMVWNDGPNESDIVELKAVAFYYIRMKMPHLRIRDLKDHFAIEDSWKEQRRVLEEVNPEVSKEEKKSGGIIITKVEENDEGDEFEQKEVENPILTTAEERDIQEEAIWKKNREKKLKTIYEDSKEREQIHKNLNKPLDLAKRALNQIKGIKVIPGEYDKDLDSVLGDIIHETNNRRKILQKSR